VTGWVVGRFGGFRMDLRTWSETRSILGAFALKNKTLPQRRPSFSQMAQRPEPCFNLGQSAAGKALNICIYTVNRLYFASLRYILTSLFSGLLWPSFAALLAGNGSTSY